MASIKYSNEFFDYLCFLTSSPRFAPIEEKPVLIVFWTKSRDFLFERTNVPAGPGRLTIGPKHAKQANPRNHGGPNCLLCFWMIHFKHCAPLSKWRFPRLGCDLRLAKGGSSYTSPCTACQLSARTGYRLHFWTFVVTSFGRRVFQKA